MLWDFTRPARAPRLFLQTMIAAASTCTLEARLAELMMSSLAPCDLGDGIEVVHDVEAVEIEMDCDLADDAAIEPAPDDTIRTIKLWFDDEVVNTTKFAREVADDHGTRQFIRHSAPYERIEIQLDSNAFLRATIEDARTPQRPPRRRVVHRRPAGQ